MKQSLVIQDYEVWVNLGCSKEEQEYLQPVHYNMELFFEEVVLGCNSDQLADAIDYVAITNILKNVSIEKKVHLIEHLNQKVMLALLEYLKIKNFKGKIKLSVKKIRVPVENLRNGVVFLCETQL